jgi:hypothetical protein
MPAKKTRKKDAKDSADKEKILEKVDEALSENVGVEATEEKTDEDIKESVEEKIEALGESSDEEDPEKEKIEAEEENLEKEENPENTDLSDVNPSTDSIFSSPPEDGSPKKGKSTSLIIIICLCVIFLLAGFVGGYFYAKNLSPQADSQKSEKKMKVENTSTPTPTEEEIDLSAYSIEVLNGSGIGGVAGKEKSALEDDGFTVENTGNADTQDYSETSISFKAGVPDAFIDELKKSLSKRYVIASDAGELDDESDYDVVITLGSEIAAEEE